MGDEHRVLPGRRSHRQQALHSACQVLVVGVGEGLIQEVPCHAHAIPTKASSAVSRVRAYGLASTVPTGIPRRRIARPSWRACSRPSSERFRWVLGSARSGLGSSWVGSVAAWRMKMTCPPWRRRAMRSRPPGCSASVDGTPDPVDPLGPGRFPPHPVTAASRRHATSATVRRAAVPPGRARRLMRFRARTRGRRSSCHQSAPTSELALARRWPSPEAGGTDGGALNRRSYYRHMMSGAARRAGWLARLAVLAVLVTGCERSSEPAADPPRPTATTAPRWPRGSAGAGVSGPGREPAPRRRPGLRRPLGLVHRPGVRAARPAGPGHRREPADPARGGLGAARRDRRSGWGTVDHRRWPERDRAGRSPD